MAKSVEQSSEKAKPGGLKPLLVILAACWLPATGALADCVAAILRYLDELDPVDGLDGLDGLDNSSR